MSKKIYDLAVKTDEYTNREGQQKAKWLNVGAVMQKDDGGKFILLERSFNPAGVLNPDNRPNIILSMFSPKDRQQGPPDHKDPASPQYRGASAGNSAGFTDDIPY